VLSLSLLFAIWPASSAGALDFTPCTDNQGFTCTTVSVPLDHTGQLPGALALKVERRQAGSAQSSEAVVALAGGPGQAAIPLAGFLAKALAPALSTRDLLVFDQRGTGQSAPLSCPALASAAGAVGVKSVGQLFERCALQLGPARGSYTTQDSVQDIESIRQATGYEKLVLYGVSYGTKVALEYAARYPQHVSELVLDSVEPTDGPEPFQLGTLQAIRPVLAELCSEGACNDITANPLTDLARLAAQLHDHPRSGSVYDGAGHRHTVAINESDLLGILGAGDLNPALRALLPAAVHSALKGDSSPLLRLDLLARGLIPTVPGAPPGESAEGIDGALNATTICEESPFPWGRSDPVSARPAETIAALNALPSTSFYPFDAGVALEDSTILGCLDWPNASPPPPVINALPNVPTLILSGEQDLRTPTTNARKVAAMIPDAQLLLVPYTGHSVLGTDFSGCAEGAVEAFFAGNPVQACPTTPDIFTPTPLAPTRLGSVRPAPHVPGRAGRTLTAVLDTILDLDRQVISSTLQANQELPSGSSFGGLRGGYAKLSSGTMRLHRFSFISGVELDGAFKLKRLRLQTGTVRIGGSAASAGTVRIESSGKRVSGALGGRRFSFDVSEAKLTRVTFNHGEWSSLATAFPLPGLARLR
jgi:pimeloyl-ACP methyl ester carboxylesterase